MFKFDIDRLDSDKELGQGEYGRVFVYEAPNTSRKCAVKMVRARNIEELRMFIEELVLSFNLSHPAILPITGFHIDEEKPKGWTVYMRMQLMTRNLRTLIQEHKKNKSFLSKDQIVKIFHALAAGMEYLFSRNIVHRDIKPENVLLDEADNVKIGDIGIAKFKSPDDTTKTMMSMKGTPTYMAPELFQPELKLDWSQENLCKADVWSLGVTIMELCLIECEKIFPHLHISEKAKIVERNLEKVKEKYGSDLSSILAGLVHINPAKRKSFESIAKTLRESYPSVIKTKEQGHSMDDAQMQEFEARASGFAQKIEEKDEKISEYQTEIEELRTKVNQLELDQNKSKNPMTKNKNIWMWVILIASLVFNIGASMNFFNGMQSNQSQVSYQDITAHIDIKQVPRPTPGQTKTTSSQTLEEPDASEIENTGGKGDKHRTIISLSSLWIQIIPLSVVPLGILAKKLDLESKYRKQAPPKFKKYGQYYINTVIIVALISAEDILYSLKEDYQNIGHLTGFVSLVVHLALLVIDLIMALHGLINLRTKFNPIKSTRNQQYMYVFCSYMARIMISALVSLLFSSSSGFYVLIQFSISIVFFKMLFRFRSKLIGMEKSNIANIIFYIPCVVFLLINLRLMGIMLFSSGSSEMYSSVAIGNTIAKLSFAPFIFINFMPKSQS